MLPEWTVVTANAFRATTLDIETAERQCEQALELLDTAIADWDARLMKGTRVLVEWIGKEHNFDFIGKKDGAIYFSLGKRVLVEGIMEVDDTVHLSHYKDTWRVVIQQ